MLLLTHRHQMQVIFTMFRKKDCQQIAAWLENGTRIRGDIIRRARRLEQLRMHMKECWPSGVDQELEIMNVREGRLILGVSHSVWATRVRFLAPQIIENARKYWEEPIERVECRLWRHH